MEFSVSTLSYSGPKMWLMKRLSKEFGIEIFWDWGNEDFWKEMVAKWMRQHTGSFSIHGPMTYVSFTDDVPSDVIFEKLKKPFDLYHCCNSKFYVLHTHDNGFLSAEVSDDGLLKKRDLAIERMVAFNEICKAEGVQLVIENIGKGKGGKTPFTESDFIALFRNNPDLKCLLDVGHAVLGDYDIGKVQKALGEQLVAYHLHDNRGKADNHLRIREGVIDWQQWKQNCYAYTPHAEIVLEYDHITDENVYLADMKWIQSEVD